MKFLLTVFGEIGFFEYPKGTSGWLVCFAFLALLLWLLWTLNKYNTPSKKFSWEILFILLLAIPITSFLFSIRLDVGSALSLPGIPLLPAGSLVLLLSAIPWMLAGGYLGPLPAAILGAFSGLIFGYYGNHNFFMPLVFALLAAFFSFLIRQQYRTTFFALLRRPFIASIILSIAYPVLFSISSVFVLNSTLPIRIDYILSHLGGESLAFAIQALLAGVIVEIIAIRFPEKWFAGEALEPSPSESSLEARLFSVMAPLVLLFVLILMAGDWIVAGNVSREMLETQMRLTADTAAESIPIIQSTGQSLLNQAREDERLYSETNVEILTLALKEIIRETPFFDQLSIVDVEQKSIAGYPENNFENLLPSQYERMGIELAINDLDFQYYTLAPQSSGMSARLSFIVPIYNSTGMVERILVGRTSLDTNPFFTSVLNNLKQMTEVGGQAALIDSQNQVLFHTQSNKIGAAFDSDILGEENFFYGTNSKGVRILEYFKPVEGQSWAVVTTVPAQVAQQAAMDIAIPLLGILGGLILLAYFLLRISLRSVTRSIESLVAGSVRMSQGNLDQALVLKGSDEVGQLGHSFEKMRRSMKSRLDDSDRLLLVSQGIASSLDIESAIQPLLEGALASGGSSARLIMTIDALSDFQKPTKKHYGLGEKSSSYAGIDDQILDLSKRQKEIVLKDLSRSKLVHPKGLPLPSSLIALALKKDKIFFGNLWVGYQNPHNFSKEEVTYLSKVAEQASQAIYNSREHLTAVLERQRLESILMSTKDPVVVTNQQDQILFVNPAAKSLLGKDSLPASGMSINKLRAPEILIDLLKSNKSEASTVNIVFEKDKIYNAAASAILADGQVVGRVCVLRDLSYIQEGEEKKAELISLVSHELRSPLTLAQGSATMLKRIGDLNDEQDGFVQKIITAVESMTDMVNNMLMIERIEEEDGLQTEELSVVDLASQAIETIQIMAVQKQIKLTLEVPEKEVPLITADKTLLLQAFHNLIDNGISYTESGGSVEISIDQKPDAVVFMVKDTGVGIAPLDQQKVFERFYRVESFERTEDKSSGLGLSIVKSIAEKHGGKVYVESQLGLGSRFYLSIPIKK